MKCFSLASLRLCLSTLDLLLSHRWIVNPHCGAASGRALGPYFRGQIHHVWCGWCSYNSSLTGVMFAGIIQHSINTRAWKKYGAFIKTVNRQSLLQKNREKKTRRLSLTSRYALLYCSCHLMMTEEMPYRNNSGKQIYWNRSTCHMRVLFYFFIYSHDSELLYLQLLQNTDIKCYICIKFCVNLIRKHFNNETCKCANKLTRILR